MLSLNAWDVAAGALLVIEAGGRVGDFAGGNEYMRSNEVIAAAPGVFNPLREAIAAPTRADGRPLPVPAGGPARDAEAAFLGMLANPAAQRSRGFPRTGRSARRPEALYPRLWPSPPTRCRPPVVLAAGRPAYSMYAQMRRERA